MVHLLAHLAFFDPVTELEDGCESTLRVFDFLVLFQLVTVIAFLVWHEVRAVETDDSEYLHDEDDQVAVEDGLGESNVTEMARAVGLVTHTSLAEAVSIHGSHKVVVDTLLDGVSGICVGAVIGDVGH